MQIFVHQKWNFLNEKPTFEVLDLVPFSGRIYYGHPFFGHGHSMLLCGQDIRFVYFDYVRI